MLSAEVWSLVKVQTHHFNVSQRFTKNILSTVGIPCSKWVINNLIDLATELILAKPVLMINSIRIILPTETIQHKSF